MSIADLYSRTVSTQRTAVVGTSKRREWGDNLTGLACAIHEVEATQTDLANGSGGFMKSYKLWCPLTTDIKIGDRVVDEDDVSYTVKSVKKYNYGKNTHLLIVMNEGV